MSMLSAQCDELRERAATLRQGRWSDGADDARLMEDAADTIWELRDSVHRERAEADKLREMSSALRQCLEWESCKGCPMQDKAGWCVRDNRLRELGIEVDA